MGGDRYINIMIVVMVSQVYTYIEVYQTFKKSSIKLFFKKFT